MILNEPTLTTSPKKSKKKKKDKDKEKELEEAKNLIDAMNSSINGPEKKKKNKKDKNRSRSPSPDLDTPITEKPSPKKSVSKFVNLDFYNPILDMLSKCLSIWIRMIIRDHPFITSAKFSTSFDIPMVNVSKTDHFLDRISPFPDVMYGWSLSFVL